MLKEAVTIITSVTAVIAGILGILKYFQYRTRRDKILLVRQAFETTVKSLASNVELERMAGAILLRRFFVGKSEVGIAGIPVYGQEALYVTAAILRGQVSGSFQKVLADGLADAPSLKGADLQRTNLQFAYLGLRKKAGGETDPMDLRYADFYRADLTRASLKGANAFGAVFYQARMRNTVLTAADLRDANFFEADLKGARFDSAQLYGAQFKSARNIPASLAAKLDEDGVFRQKEAFHPPKDALETRQIRVFMSKPGLLDYQQQQYVSGLMSRLESEGIVPQSLERQDYRQFGAMGEIQRVMSDCSGAIVFGFKQLEVRVGLWRASSPEEKLVKDCYLSTPWNQIEAGMAAMLDLPILVISQRGVEGGIFDVDLEENQIYRVFMDEDWSTGSYVSTVAEWSSNVRERNRPSG